MKGFLPYLCAIPIIGIMVLWLAPNLGNNLPLLGLLLLCPLMHIFMMKDHGHEHDHDNHAPEESDKLKLSSSQEVRKHED